MITLDGKTLEEFELICEKQITPMTPKISNKTISIPGRAGLYDFGTEINEREISFEMATIADNKTALQYILRKFTMFIFDQYGKSRDIKLVFVNEPDKFYTVRCSDTIDAERVYTTGKFKITFSVYDPFAYNTIYSNELSWGSEEITFGSTYLLGNKGTPGETHITSRQSVMATVLGLAIKPIIEIVGSATNLVISANGYIVNVGTFTDNSWIINCEKYTVQKNGNNSFGTVKLREFFLVQGDNEIVINADLIDITFRLRYRDKYL